MNTIAFGSAIWNVLHKIPRTYPNEILSVEDGSNAIRFVVFMGYILPCKYCRDSATVFIQELDIIDRMTLTFPDGKKSVTKGKFSETVWILNNRVNYKLQKKMFGVNWCDAALVPRPGWKKSFWVVMFTICWNYPEDPDEDSISKYYTFFGELLPKVIKYTDVGRDYAKVLEKLPVTKDNVLVDRNSIKRWIYEMYKRCSKNAWTFEDTDVVIEAFRARSSACTAKGSLMQSPNDAPPQDVKDSLDIAKGCN
jgi:hypothetical protein